MIKSIQKRLRNRKGFTLVELIVVIAVLGVLASIAVPRLTGFTDDAEEQASETNKKLLEKAATYYLAANNNPDSTITWDGTNTSPASLEWQDYLDEWPDNFDGSTDFEVEIATDGTITITEE